MKTRTVKLRAVLDNKNDAFKPGMFVEGKIEGMILNGENTLIIPSTAILWTGKRSVVYLKTNPNEPIFEMREVLLGNNIEDGYEVLEGLIDGDEIVTNGTFTIDAAAQLQGKKSMMNKEGGRITTGHEGHTGMETTNTNADNSIVNKRIEVSIKFQNQLKAVFNAYIKLKDDLIKEDAKSVSVNANKLLKELSNVDMTLLPDAKAHQIWMPLEREIKSLANSFTTTSSVKEQRNHFKLLSYHLINAIQVFGVNEKVYSQFCPMADNNKGGYWLSKDEKVLNPYFGDAMLTCGSVKQIIE